MPIRFTNMNGTKQSDPSWGIRANTNIVQVFAKLKQKTCADRDVPVTSKM